jgi:hypothetical protein
MTKAFDSALFIPPNPNTRELVEVVSPGPPLKTQWGNYISGPPGISVEASIPAATGQGQSMVSGPAPDFDWTPVLTASNLPTPTGPGQTYVSAPDDPFPMQLAPAVPQATAINMVMVSGAAPYNWTTMTSANLVVLGGAVTNSGGAAFGVGANVVFAPATGLTTRINGFNPAMSAIDNFTIDAGTF